MDEDSQLREKSGELLYTFRIPIALFLIAIIFFSASYFIKNGGFQKENTVEVLNASDEKISNGKIIVEISGAVEKPGVYNFEEGARVNDLLETSGGLSEKADTKWVEKNVNRASLLVDGQKIYILSLDEQSSVLSANNSGVYQNTSGDNNQNIGGLININTADSKTLDTLPGIGPVYAQRIIEQRPYSTLEEFRKKTVVPTSTYEKIKNFITVY